MAFKALTTLAFVATLAAGVFVSGPAKSGEFPPQQEGDARHQPILSFSHAVGSKAMIGYSVERNSVCLVTLMIIARNDPESSHRSRRPASA
jgi:hypothetical protein